MTIELSSRFLCLLTSLLLVAGARSQEPASACTEVSIVIEHVTRIADPKLSGGDVVIQFHTEPAGTSSEVVVEILDSAANLVRELHNGLVTSGMKELHAWNGKDAAGKYLPPGSYQVRIRNSTDEETVPVSLVRLGITEVQSLPSADDAADVFPLVYFYFDEEDDDGDGAPHVTLSFDGTPSTEYRNAANPGELSDLDLDTGEPRPIPPVHTDVLRPILGEDHFLTDNTYNYPRCYKMGVRPRFRLTMGTGSTSAHTGTAAPAGVGYPISGFDLRLILTAAGSSSASPVFTTGPGESVVVQGPELPAEVTRVDEFEESPVKFSWQYRETTAAIPSWVNIPGSVAIPMRFYTTLDTPRFPTGLDDTPYLGPWIVVADLWHQWNIRRPDGPVHIDNAEECIENLLHGIFRKVYPDGPLHHLLYQGSPSYLKGSHRDPSWPNMNLASLLALREGTGVNCADCMGMSISMLSMMGVSDVRGVLLTGAADCSGRSNKIPLLPTRPLGAAVLTSATDPMCFSFHYVTTRDGGAKIIDAAVQLEDVSISTWDDERDFASYTEKLTTSPTLSKDLSVVDSIPYLDGYIPSPTTP